MPPGGGDLQHPLHRALAPDLGKVRQGEVLLVPLPHRGGVDGGPAGQVVGQLAHRLHGVDGEALGQGGLRGAVRRDEEAADPRRPGGQGHGEHPHHRPQGAGEGELPHEGTVGVGPVQLPGGGEDAHQNGQVVHRAGLPPVGGGQVHGDPPHGKGVAAVLDGRPDPLPGLLHGGVGEPHDVEVGQAPGQVALGGDLIPGDALEPQGTHFAQHGEPPFPEGDNIPPLLCHKTPRETRENPPFHEKSPCPKGQGAGRKGGPPFRRPQASRARRAARGPAGPSGTVPSPVSQV